MLGGMAGRVKRPDAEVCLTLEILLVKSGYEGESDSRAGRENQVRPGLAGQVTAPTHIVVVNVGLEHVGDRQPGYCTEEPVDVALRIDHDCRLLVSEDICCVSQTGSADRFDLHAGLPDH
jgi:hypothetical protein